MYLEYKPLVIFPFYFVKFVKKSVLKDLRIFLLGTIGIVDLS